MSVAETMARREQPNYSLEHAWMTHHMQPFFIFLYAGAFIFGQNNFDFWLKQVRARVIYYTMLVVRVLIFPRVAVAV